MKKIILAILKSTLKQLMQNLLNAFIKELTTKHLAGQQFTTDVTIQLGNIAQAEIDTLIENELNKI